MLPTYITGLLYPQIKTARARSHLELLRSKVSEFRNGKPYTVTEQDDTERGDYVVRVAINPADVMIPVLLGEFAFSLRSALDHLAWQLGLLSSRIPSRSSQFPIHTSDTRKDRERFMLATWDIPPAAIEIIKSLQPYMRGKTYKTHPLWQLNKLCNLDKHATVGFGHTVANIFVPPEAKVLADDIAGATEIRMPLALKSKRQIEFYPPKLVFGRPIEIPGPEFELTEEQIAQIYSYFLTDVLPPFAPFFPGCPTIDTLPDLRPLKPGAITRTEGPSKA